MHPVALVLVDFDDTLVDTAPRFARARRELFAILEQQGFDPDHAHDVHHHQVDAGLRARYGFGPHRLEEAFRLTYEALCRHDGRRPDEAVTERCGALGRNVVGTPPLLDGALDALRGLAELYPTVVYTQASDRDYQLACLGDAGVLDVVGTDRVRVVTAKTTQAFRDTLAAFGVADPSTAWMVGNSIRSDVNPALSAGAHAILVEVEDPWHHDMVEPVHPQFDRVKSFAEAVELLVKRVG